MECPECQAENREEVIFCEECGAKMEIVCPSCVQTIPMEKKFCGKCGYDLTKPAEAPSVDYEQPQSYTPKFLAEKILTTRSSIEGERKQVTVLFCDICNSTALAERLGPEAFHTLLNRFFELALTEVHRYEGTINQFLGDGFMALFGAPIAHEDHSRRAMLAAVSIQQAMKEERAVLGAEHAAELAVRMGLNAGPVVVGAIGDNLRMDYTAVGDTTNLAAHLQQAADPGQVVISEATHRLVAGYCSTKSLGELPLKGKTEPIPAWEVVAARETRTRLEVEAERGLTPFVGRERELQMLSERFEEAKASQGQVIFIAGEAGIGKSRLLLEFRQRLGVDATWLEGHAMSFGRSIAFHPLIDLLKRNFRIEEADSEDLIVEKIAGGVLPLGEELRPILPYLRYLLAVDPGDPAIRTLDPLLRRAEIFDSLRRLMIRAAERKPQILVFEDLHWMDEATEAFLAFIDDSIPTSRVLCLYTYRPGYVHPFVERTYHTRVVIPTLSSEDSVQMALAMLAVEHLPEALQTLIVQKAEGNPFFVEEVVKSLREVGAIRLTGDRYVLTRPLEEIAVPDTIQDVIMARIDRLEEAPKKTLQLASVIGREFTRRLVDRLADIRESTEAYLQELKTIELIYEKSLFPELSYMFKHALTQDVAYNSLLVQRRQELHSIIGRAIEELYADRLAEHYEVLAYHFARGEEWIKALEYFLKAGEKATQAFATREAIALYDQALEAAGYLGDEVDAKTMMAIHQAKADLYMALSDFESSLVEGDRRMVLARQAGDQVSEGAALASMGFSSLYTHDFDRALDYSRQAIEIAKEMNAKTVLAGAHFNFAWVYALTARLDQAKEEVDQALNISRSVGDVVYQSFSLHLYGAIKNWEGEYEEALCLLNDSIRIGREHKLPMLLLQCLFFKGLTLTGNGDYDAARITFEEDLALSEKVGDEIWYHRLLNGLGWLYIECGDLDHAMDFNRQGAERAHKWGNPETIANSELNLGDIFLAQGDLALAQEFLDGVYRLANDPTTSEWMRWRYSTHLFTSLGELWVARGDFAKALEYAEQGLEIATRTNSRKYLVKGWRLKGEIALFRKQWDEADKWLRQALSIAQVVGNPTQLWKTHTALARLYENIKRPDLEREQWNAAAAVVRSTADGLTDETLRNTFINAAPVREITDNSDR